MECGLYPARIAYVRTLKNHSDSTVAYPRSSEVAMSPQHFLVRKQSQCSVAVAYVETCGLERTTAVVITFTLILNMFHS